MSFNSTHRWILSGTPIQNKQSDIINLFKFIGIVLPKKGNQPKEYIDNYLLRRNKTLIYDNVFTEYKTIDHDVVIDTQEEQTMYKKIQKE